MRRWATVLVVVAALLLLAAGAWLAWSARAVAQQLSIAREQLTIAQRTMSMQDVEGASQALNSATSAAVQASEEVSQPIWALIEAVPKLGDTPSAVHGVTTALQQALTALAPAAESLVRLDPQTLVQQGVLDLPALQAAQPLLVNAQTGVEKALATLSTAPQAANGDLVVRDVDMAQKQLTDELNKIGDTLSDVSVFAELAPPLLGVSSPQRYFMAVLNPNENRGGGGFLGTWAVVRAMQGRLTVEEVGSNSDLTSFESLPVDLGKDFENRYGSDPALIGNANLSPNFPSGAKLWLASYEAATGKKLNGVLSADVVALGDLVTASGQLVTLPDGPTLTGKQLTQFALYGIYAKFPGADQVQQRKEYQELVVNQALNGLTSGKNPRAMFEQLAKAAGNRRVMLYSTDQKIQAELATRSIGGALATDKGPNALFATINVSGSKLDVWLTQKVQYEVGRCADTTGMVRSQVNVQLNSNIFSDLQVPAYMVGLAEMSSRGPINRTLAQLHLPVGAQVTSVTVDGVQEGFAPFMEEGRPGVFIDVSLTPRVPVDISVFFNEPMSVKPASLVVQPLADAPKTDVIERTC